MKVAVVGSRTLTVKNLEEYLPEGTRCIISGGARGVDASARAHALKSGLEYVEFKPDYDRDGGAAPFVRNWQIAAACDLMVAFWDGKSGGTRQAVACARSQGKPVRLFVQQDASRA